MVKLIKCDKCDGLNYMQENEDMCDVCKQKDKEFRTRVRGESRDWFPRDEVIADRALNFKRWLDAQAKKKNLDNSTVNVYYNALGREWAGNLNRASKIGVPVKDSAFDYDAVGDFETIVNLLNSKSSEEAGANFRQGAILYLEFLQAK